MRPRLPVLLPLLAVALARPSMASDPWDCRQEDKGRWVCVPAQPAEPAKPPGQAGPDTRQPASPAPEKDPKAP